MISIQTHNTESMRQEAELIDSGKYIRFSSPALLGREAILRTYSTDGEKARKNGLEQIKLTPAEQRATGI
jgi:hypothetical protein